MKQVVYVAAGLTNASDEFSDFARTFKRNLRQSTAALVIEWIGRESPIELDDFFQRNLNNVRMCDSMIALVDEPSIGVGIEIREAMLLQKPLLCLHQENQVISRLLASAGRASEMTIRSYKNIYDAVDIAAHFISTSPLLALHES